MISVVILTKNSSAYLERCLRVLHKFSEVIIVDNGSTDDTMEIAQQFPNVKIYEREFCGFGPLKNIGADLATNDWVLFVDSDEVLHPDLADFILDIQLDNNKVYQFYRKNYYNNMLIDGCSWDNDYVTRLFNRKVTRFNDNQVHESIITKSLTVEQIKPDFNKFIYHFPYNNTSQLMAKLEHYANLYAANNYGKKSVRLWMIPLKAIAAFIKNYFIKKGFKYGYEGFLISSYNTMGVLVKYLKLYELSQKRNLAIAFTIDSLDIDLNQLVQSINQQKLLPAQVIFLVTNHVLVQKQVQFQSLCQQGLVIPAQIIRMDSQDSQLVVSNYLIEHHSVEGVILYNSFQLLENEDALYSAYSMLLRGKKFAASDVKFFQNLSTN